MGASCSDSEAAISGWGPARRHQMCQLCFLCFDVSDVSCVFILVVWIREPPQMWHIKGETLNKRVCGRFLQIGGFDGYKNDVSLESSTRSDTCGWFWFSDINKVLHHQHQTPDLSSCMILEDLCREATRLFWLLVVSQCLRFSSKSSDV